MKTSIECLKELIEQLGDDWKHVLDDFFKVEENELDDATSNDIIDFLNVCKEEIIEDKTSSLQKVEKLIDNDLLYKNIQSYVDDMLRPYYASAPLRTLEVKNQELAIATVEEIFNRAILRFDPNIPKKYEEFGFENDNAFVEFLNILDSICTFVVGKNFCIEAIEDFCYAQTRLPKKLCKKIAELLDANLTQLKLNFIVEKLNKQ